MKLASLAVSLLAAASVLPAGAADESTEVGDYVIYHTAYPTDTLSVEVARAYGIVRSKNRALLNISVIRQEEGTTGTPVHAEIDARANNLSGQLKELDLRLIEEGPAVYYIGELPVSDGETLIFDLEIRPADDDRSYEVRFQQTFYAN